MKTDAIGSYSFLLIGEQIQHYISEPNNAPPYGYQDNSITGIGFWMMQGGRMAISLWKQGTASDSTLACCTKKVLAVFLAVITSPLTAFGAILKGIGSKFPHRVENLTLADIPNTDPVKVDQIYDLLQIVSTILNENNINYSMDGGTLLGAIRHQGVTPGDDDGDLFIMDTDKERFVALQDQFRQRGIIFAGNGLEAFKLVFDPQTLEQRYGVAESANLDLFIMTQDPDGNYRYKSQFLRTQFPSEYFQPNELQNLQEYPFGPLERGLTLKGPAEPRRYLLEFYGPECFQYALRTHSHIQLGPIPFPILNFSMTKYAVGENPPFAEGQQWRSQAQTI